MFPYIMKRCIIYLKGTILGRWLCLQIAPDPNTAEKEIVAPSFVLVGFQQFARLGLPIPVAFPIATVACFSSRSIFYNGGVDSADGVGSADGASGAGSAGGAYDMNAWDQGEQEYLQRRPVVVVKLGLLEVEVELEVSQKPDPEYLIRLRLK